MNEVMTKAEIYERFPREWVLIGDPQKDAQGLVVGGTLLWHSKDRDEVDAKLLELRPRDCAIFYTGPIPEPGTRVILSASQAREHIQQGARR
jgi:hypothetical protein